MIKNVKFANEVIEYVNKCASETEIIIVINERDNS
jgi:hypothetical protein